MSLRDVHAAIMEIAATASTTDKVAIIKRSLKIPNFDKVCYYALNPFYAFNARSVIGTKKVLRRPSVQSIFSYLDKLREQRGASKEDREALGYIASIDKETTDVVNMILKKDLRCGANAKLFTKAGLSIPQHSLMLCLDGSPSKEKERLSNRKKFNKLAKTANNACWSIKKNGARSWAVVHKNNVVEYISRSGKTPPNFNVFDDGLIKRRDDLNKMCGKDFDYVIFDGEVTTTEGTFKSVMQNFRRLEGADSNKFVFEMFDIVLEDMVLSERYGILVQLSEAYKDNITHVEHTTLNSFDEMFSILDEQDANGEEGIVVKCWDSLYEMKRSNYWMKLKKFYSDEFKVVGWEYGKGKYSDVVGVLLIDVNGKVGKVTPRTDKDRKDFLKHLPSLVEVRYKEMTDDGALLFPTLLTVRDDK